jgi:hypothetical protein
MVSSHTADVVLHSIKDMGIREEEEGVKHRIECWVIERE